MNILERILVATDFSAAGHNAVERAGQLASQHKAQLRVVHAAPDWKLFSRWTSARHEHFEALSERANQTMHREVDWVRSQFAVEASSETRLGRASEVIAQATLDYRPSLIVMGARGEHQPRISPESFGGTTLKLLLHTDFPLLLVRGWNTKPYRTSLAAVHDVCEVSNRVVLWGSALVDGGDCHVMHAYEAPYIERTSACVTETVVQECNSAAESVARRLVREAAAAALPGAHIHTHAVRGNPLGALITEIARYQPTLVVLGRKELTAGATREPFGTEGFRMAYHCPVDTLVVP
jgi:universal stress protein E